jgi:hypothetical protein
MWRHGRPLNAGHGEGRLRDIGRGIAVGSGLCWQGTTELEACAVGQPLALAQPLGPEPVPLARHSFRTIRSGRGL